MERTARSHGSNGATASNVAMQHEEIGVPMPETGTPKIPFGRRLRLALEQLEEGKSITIRTKTERQHVTNVVSNVQKKLGVRLVTNLLVRRNDDPEGKIVIKIRRLSKD